MKGLKYGALLCCLAAVAGCAALFGRSTKDPAVMLTWASEEFSSRDNPVAAEELLQEALQIYRRKMDRLGQAETCRQYGLFLRSNAVTKFKDHYNTIGFLDETVKFANRYEKSIEYFTKARSIFAEYNRYEALSSIDISLAKTYAHLGRNPEACAALGRSLGNYNAHKKAMTDMKEFQTEEVSDYEEYVGIIRKQLACEETIDLKK